MRRWRGWRKQAPGALTSSYFSTGNPMYVSRDRHTTFLQVYPAGQHRLDVKSGALTLLRSMGIGGMLIPVVSVLASLTLLPAMLAVLGQRVNRVRVMPRRLIDRGHPEEGAWGRWARFVLRRPIAVAAVGVAIVAVLAGLGTQLNANAAQLKYFPGSGTAIAARDHPSDHRPRQREPSRNQRHADRHRRDRPRLPARPVRQLPLRACACPAPDAAIELGLARTGKLVTSAALILMFAFLVLSSTPGYEVKSLAIGLAAGIIYDATVIRALLVPALMKLLGDGNWWMPKWTGIILRIPHREPAPEIAAESA